MTGMSIWKKWNPNPCLRSVGDCAVRAIAAALGLTWEEAFDILCDAGRAMCDLPNSDATWGAVLRMHGFRRFAVVTGCVDCYTAEDFARDHPRGVFVLGFGGHVATLIDGRLWDSWDSTQEIPQFYWEG